MNRSGEEQERLLALLEEEAQRTHSNKSHKDQREGQTTFKNTNSSESNMSCTYDYSTTHYALIGLIYSLSHLLPGLL